MLDNDSSQVLSDSSLALVEELRSVRDFMKKLKARESEIRSVLLEELGGASSGITASGVPLVQVSYQSRDGLDKKKLQALYPDEYADCLTESTVTVLRLAQDDVADNVSDV